MSAPILCLFILSLYVGWAVGWFCNLFGKKSFKSIFIKPGNFPDPPYCVGTLHRKVVVARHSTVALSCAVEANPTNVTFTWRVDKRSKRKFPSKNRAGHKKDHTGSEYMPRLIDLVPRSNSTKDRHLPEEKTYMAYGPSLPHSIDPKVPTRSLLKVTPTEDAMEIVCFAKNRVGRMRVPCYYSLVVIGKSRKL